MTMLEALAISDTSEFGPVGRIRGEGLERVLVSCKGDVLEDEAVGDSPEGG